MTHLSNVVGGAAGLPDLDRIREILERIQHVLVMGGVALAAAGALAFLGLWAVSFLRRPAVRPVRRHPWLTRFVLMLAHVPVGLALLAGVGFAIAPPLAPYVLKALAGAVVGSAAVWCLAAACLLLGGTARDLARVRRAILLAGTPWYCLVLFLLLYL